ncbi:MAG: hypothetical protein AB1697_02725 [Pseudomonadota bacterium]
MTGFLTEAAFLAGAAFGADLIGALAVFALAGFFAGAAFFTGFLTGALLTTGFFGAAFFEAGAFLSAVALATVFLACVAGFFADFRAGRAACFFAVAMVSMPSEHNQN